MSVTGDLSAAVDGADAVFIAVGTPTQRGDGHADLTYVMAAAEEIAQAITGFRVVVTKSTVPVGKNRQVKQTITKANPDAEFAVASNPEFLREGAAIDDFMRPDRVAVGVQNEQAAEVMTAIYRPLSLRDFPIMVTDLESAEMINCGANAFLAAKINFINEIAALCDDTVNGKVIAALGVTFKSNTDDMRDAPSLTILPALVGGGAKVRVVDPQGRREGTDLLPGVNWVEDAHKAAQNADAVVILTEWNELRGLDLKRI